VHAMTDNFTKALYRIFLEVEHIPNFEKIVKLSDAPWFNGHLKRAINRRNKAYCKLVKNNNEVNYRNFKDTSLITGLKYVIL
jgi:hypothetical protein